MTGDELDWWSILRALDEPGAPPEDIRLEPMLQALDEPIASGQGDGLEVPRDFDYVATQARFDRLVERLSESYGCPCDSGLAQDSACFGSVWIPGEASRSRTKRTRIPLRLSVSVSKFGGLATYGPHTPCGQVAHVHPQDRQRIEEVLDRLGYLVVPGHVLTAPYDGPNGWVFGPTTNATWFTRFFDYL